MAISLRRIAQRQNIADQMIIRVNTFQKRPLFIGVRYRAESNALSAYNYMRVNLDVLSRRKAASLFDKAEDSSCDIATLREKANRENYYDVVMETPEAGNYDDIPIGLRYAEYLSRKLKRM